MSSLRILAACPTVNGWLRGEAACFLANAGAANILPVRGFLTDVARNGIVAEALRRKADVLVMVDADADPAPGTWEAIVEAALSTGGVVGVPHCTAGGHVAVHVEPGESDIELRDAVSRTGLHEVSDVATHCVAYPVEVFRKVSPPWYSYTYNEKHTAFVNTEDCVCHRKLREAGVRFWCHFDYWAGHWKEKCIGKPELLTAEKLNVLRMVVGG